MGGFSKKHGLPLVVGSDARARACGLYFSGSPYFSRARWAAATIWARSRSGATTDSAPPALRVARLPNRVMNGNLTGETLSLTVKEKRSDPPFLNNPRTALGDLDGDFNRFA